METAVKQRLIGAAVLAALAMIFLPLLLTEPQGDASDASQVPLEMPKAPSEGMETHELPLLLPAKPAGDITAPTTAPEATPAAVDPNAVVTVDASSAPAPRSDEAAAVAVDAASGEPMPPPASPAAPAPSAVAAPELSPALPAPLPQATAAGNYAVNVGSFSNLDNARALEAKLRAANLPVRSETLNLSGKPGLRLRVGPYAERAAAEAARLRVQGVAGAQAQVIVLDASSKSTAPAAAVPMAAKVGFAVQLGALKSEADAIALRDRVRAAGFPAFHQRMETANGVLFRVRVGPEADRAAAETLRNEVQARVGIAGLIVSHP